MGKIDPMYERERVACVRYLRAEAATLQTAYDALAARTPTRARLLGGIDALKRAASAIEAGAEESYFGDSYDDAD